MKFQGAVSVCIGNEGIRAVLDRETGFMRFLRVRNKKGFMGVLPGDGGVHNVGTDRTDVVQPNKDMEVKGSSLLELKTVKKGFDILRSWVIDIGQDVCAPPV